MWNDRYAQPGYLFGTEPAQFLPAHKAYLKSGLSVLAVADGEGRNSVYMAKLGLDVVAMDGSDVAIEKARALAKSEGVEVDFNLANIEDWDWAGRQFDIVAGIFIQFVGAEARKAQFAGLMQALKPGGILMLHGYTQKQLEFGTGGPPFLENLYTVDMLREAFADLEILELNAYERKIDEGPGHSGMSALVDLIARKPL